MEAVKMNFRVLTVSQLVGATLVIILSSCFSEAGLSCVSDPCLNGICIDDFNSSYSCYCTDGFTGYQCQTNWDECWSSPCLNEATCVDGIAEFNCACAPGYTGPLCGSEINECMSDPCLNNATCEDLLDGYYCDCLPGYTGINCQIDLSVCNMSLAGTDEPRCLNGGLCLDGPALSYSCLCSNGWKGKRCEEDVDECVTDPCQNRGLCLNSPGSFACACLPEFTGDHCEFRVRYCDSSECLNGGVCIEESGNSTCYCVPDFHGEQCQYQYNDCQPYAPRCMNGGSCIDGVDSYACSCLPEFSGNICECDTKLNVCQDLPFWFTNKPFRPIPTQSTEEFDPINMTVVYATSTTFFDETNDGFKPTTSVTAVVGISDELNTSISTPQFTTTSKTSTLPMEISSIEMSLQSSLTEDAEYKTETPEENWLTPSIEYGEMSPTPTLLQDMPVTPTPAIDELGIGKTFTPTLTTPDYDYYSIKYTKPPVVEPTPSIYSLETHQPYSNLTTDSTEIPDYSTEEFESSESYSSTISPMITESELDVDMTTSSDEMYEFTSYPVTSVPGDVPIRTTTDDVSTVESVTSDSILYSGTTTVADEMVTLKLVPENQMTPSTILETDGEEASSEATPITSSTTSISFDSTSLDFQETISSTEGIIQLSENTLPFTDSSIPYTGTSPAYTDFSTIYSDFGMTSTIDSSTAATADTKTRTTDETIPTSDSTIPTDDTIIPITETNVPITETSLPIADTGKLITIDPSTSISDISGPISDITTSLSDISTSISDTSTPISDTSILISDTSTPISDTITAISETVTQMSETVTPFSETITPLFDTVTPISETIAPLFDTVTPISETGTPLFDTVTPISETGTHLFDTVTPMSETTIVYTKSTAEDMTTYQTETELSTEQIDYTTDRSQADFSYVTSSIELVKVTQSTTEASSSLGTFLPTESGLISTIYNISEIESKRTTSTILDSSPIEPTSTSTTDRHRQTVSSNVTETPTSFTSTTESEISKTSSTAVETVVSTETSNQETSSVTRCDEKLCFNGGICLKISGVSTCRCPFDYTGEKCERYQYVTIPHFNGASYLKLKTPVVMDYRKGVQIYVGFTVASRNGLVFYSESEAHGSFVMLLLRNSHLTFLFSCGVQMVSFLHANDYIPPETTLHVSFKLWWTPYEAHLPWGDGKCSASLQMNDSAPLYSEQRSTSSRVVLETVYLGGLPSLYNTSWLVQAGYQPRLEGCIKTLEINGLELDIWRVATDGEHVEECGATFCPENACLNGGLCVPSPSEWTCNCTPGYEGQFCERHHCEVSPCSRGVCVPESTNTSRLLVMIQATRSDTTQTQTSERVRRSALEKNSDSENVTDLSNFKRNYNGGTYKRNTESTTILIGYDQTRNKTLTQNEYEDHTELYGSGKATNTEIFSQSELPFSNGNSSRFGGNVTLSSTLNTTSTTTTATASINKTISRLNNNDNSYVDIDFFNAHDKTKSNGEHLFDSLHTSGSEEMFTYSESYFQEMISNQSKARDSITKKFGSESSYCLCPEGYHGKFCDVHDEVRPHPPNKFFDHRKLWPRYSGSNLAGYSSFTAFKIPFDTRLSFYMRLHFRTWDVKQVGLLMLLGGKPNSAKRDFMALSLIHGHVMLTWDVGGGPRRIIAPQPLDLSRHTHSLMMGRRGKDAWVSLDTQRNVSGTAPGYLSSLETDNLLFIGGHESWSFLHLPADLWRMNGFEGCVYDIRISDNHYSLLAGNDTWVKPEVGFSRNVGHCADTSCFDHNCQNGATCHDLGATYRCTCLIAWKGPLCEIPINVCYNSSKVCAEGSSCSTNSNGEQNCICPFGKGGELCNIDIVPNTPRFRGKRSFLSVWPTESVQSECETSITFKPTKEYGVLFLSKNTISSKFHHKLLRNNIDDPNRKDYMALVLNNGSLVLTYQSGLPEKCVAVVSKEKVSLNKWNTVSFIRRGADSSLEFVGKVSTASNHEMVDEKEEERKTIGNEDIKEYKSFLSSNINYRDKLLNSSVTHKEAPHLSMNTGNELFLGGAPDIEEIPETVAPKLSTVPYEGCIKNMIINGVHYKLGEKGVPNGILRGQDVESCEENNFICDDRICQNGGKCRMNFQNEEQLSCDCLEGFSGNYCQHSSLCDPNPCKYGGSCVANSTQFKCLCTAARFGHRCQLKSVNLRSVKLSNTSHALLTRTKSSFRNTFVDSLMFEFKSSTSNGLILWLGAPGNHPNEDWIGVGVSDDEVKVVWALGAGGSAVMRSSGTGTALKGAKWQSVTVKRRGHIVTLNVDGKMFVGRSPINFSRRDGSNFVYIGNFKNVSVSHGTLGHFHQPFIGCLRNLRLQDATRLVDFSRDVEGAAIGHCS